MIDDKTRHKFLKELEKTGNIWVSCSKSNIHRSTYYRWKETSKEFRYLANKAGRQGRENMCDIAEHALLMNVKEKKMDAIKYILSHNSPRYRQKQTSNVVFVHRKDIPSNTSVKTIEDLLDEYTNEKIQTTGIVGSASLTDTPPIKPQENQTPSNNLNSISAIQYKKPDNNT